MSTYTYHPDVYYPYLIHTDVPAEESSSSSLSPQTPAEHSDSYTYSLSPQTSAGQYYLAATTSSTWDQPSQWSSWDLHQQVQASPPYQVPHTYFGSDSLAPYAEGTGSTAFAPPAAYPEATSSGGANMPVAPTTYGVYPPVAVGTPMYYQGEAEADERPPRCDVFDEPLRREDYVEREHCGGGLAHVGASESLFYEQRQQAYAPQQPTYAADVPYPDQPVYEQFYSSLPSPRKPYRVHPHVYYEQEWAAAQASSTFVPSPQQQEPPMQSLQPEAGFERQEEGQRDSYPQTVLALTMTDPYPQIPGQMWPQRHPSPAPVAIPVSSSSSLANAITPPVKKPNVPRSESTSVPATTRPSPSPPTPVPIVPSQSHLAPPPVPFAIHTGSSSKDTAFKAPSPHSPSVPPPRLPRHPRREPTSFRPFHPYPAHRHSSGSAVASSSNPAASLNDLCSAAITSPTTPLFGLFGSYPLPFPDGSDMPLPGPTCAPETSSSVMRLVLTPALKKHSQGGLLGAIGGAGGLSGLAGLLGAGSVIVPPVVRRPRLACFFCRKRKIACGPGPGAGEEGDASSSKDSPEGSSSSAIESGTGTGGKVTHRHNQDDDGPCNQCARRGLRCERPTESRRGVRKAKKSASEEDEMMHDGVVLLELVPRKKGGKKGRTDADETMAGSGGDVADEDTPGAQQ